MGGEGGRGGAHRDNGKRERDKIKTSHRHLQIRKNNVKITIRRANI